MKRMALILTAFVLLSMACSLGGFLGEESQTTQEQVPALPTEAPVSEQRCGDGICDGPENLNNCPEDCQGEVVVVQEPQEENPVEEEQAEPEEPEPVESEPAGTSIGVVYAEVDLDRTPGSGNCGIDPWYDANCTMGVSIWWDMHLKAVAITPVLIIPDGEQRWVITNHSDVTSKYDVDLSNILETMAEYTQFSIDPTVTNPECVATMQAPNFDFQVMGTRESGLTELILSANPTEYTQGTCMQAGFDWETNYLLYGWAAALSGDPLDLSFEMNDTFRTQPGYYSFEIETDTNPSPENRDHVRALLEFWCASEEIDQVRSPMACPWE
jgi:hypothetical protein